MNRLRPLRDLKNDETTIASQFVRIREADAELGLSRHTLCRLAEAGRHEMVTLSPRSKRLTRQSIDAYLGDVVSDLADVLGDEPAPSAA